MNLEPAESMALTVGLAQVQRGDVPSPNIAITCVMALSRLSMGESELREQIAGEIEALDRYEADGGIGGSGEAEIYKYGDLLKRSDVLQAIRGK